MFAELSQLDTELFLYLNSLGSTTWDTFWFYFTEKRSHIPLMLFLLVALYYTLGWKKFIVAIVVVAIMATFTDQVTNIFKNSFKRLRPCNESELLDQIRFIAKRCGKYGYFSGHSSNSMGIAVLFFNLLKSKFPKGRYFLIIWALMMGYSRIYVGVHYPGDVLSGFIFGAVSGMLFYNLYYKATTKWLNIRY